ncbi:beta-N-acetylhexosaminidase [Streptomyces qinzhouensis]|uniref:beta-N-acetylhexosaminidase n=1 Tax=Streptomyces qinzhouensis TaxID=2599401 RepID=UPI001644E00C|nr:glycoside hydrolase family 20 protein [Streptomyces qinzhouensis]
MSERLCRRIRGAALGAVLLGLALGGCSGAGSARPSAVPSPSPTRPGPPTTAPDSTHPLSTAPATVPAVTRHDPARGPGWKPGPGSRVVVAPAAGRLADEAALLARELGIPYAGTAPVRTGDIELTLDEKAAGGPESYTVRTGGGRTLITGRDEAGAFYGTRTVKQALRSGGVVPEGTVTDAPARPQRGLMVDIARKPFSARWIEDRLREAADLKLNQFGLHFSDDQGFRIESTTHPEVVSAERLTKAEVRRILALAASLHITVIPEIDSPGHLGAVLKAYPGLRLKDVSGRPVPGAVDIGNPASARLVDELLREYAGLFGGRYWHLGGDEYQALTRKDPEASFPALAALARERHGPGGRVADLATQWVNDRAAVVRALGRVPKAWNDGFFRGGRVTVDKDVQVEYWTGKEIGARPPEEYLAEGRPVVNLNDEYLYYVLGEPNDFTYPTGRRIYEEWTPLVLRGTRPVPGRYEERILGARFAVWCDLAGAQTPEQVARGIALPLAATAQKVWDERTPARSWPEFSALARRLAGS